MLDSTSHQDHIAGLFGLPSTGRVARVAQAGQAQETSRTARRCKPPVYTSRHPWGAGAAGQISSRFAHELDYGSEAFLLDAAAIIASGIASGAWYRFWPVATSADLSVFAGAGFLVSLLFCGIQRVRALRTSFRASRPGQRAREGILSWTIAFSLFLLVVVTMKVSNGLPKEGLVIFFLAGAVSVTISRLKAPILLARKLCHRAIDGQDAIVIGPRNCLELSRLTNELRETTRHEPMPVVFDATCGEAAWLKEVKQTLRHARRLAHNAGPGKILVLGHGLSADRLKILIAELALLPRAICVVPDETVTEFLNRKRTQIGDHIAVEIQPAPLNGTQRVMKRALDIVLAGSLLILLSPILAAIALMIKCDSPGPVFFRQMRTGYRGQLFRIFKFRTMTVLEDGPVVTQASKMDHRVTRIGGILRRSSLDELPQLLNVLNGDMSLVGPRPHAVAHDKSYALQIPDYMLRQHVLPGITGWAQVNGHRGETSTIDAMYRRVEHDIWYAKNCSLFLDVQIMFRTFLEVMKARNAY